MRQLFEFISSRVTKPGKATVPPHLAAAFIAAILLSACVGHLDDGPTSEGQTKAHVQVVANRFPRLSHLQWELTVVDLFHLDAPTDLSAAFTPDPLGGKAFDNNQSALEVSPSLWRDYQTAAEAVADLVTSDAAQLARFVPANLPDNPQEKARAFVEAFGLRVYRRPLLAPEVSARRALFNTGAALYPDLDPFVAGVRLSVAAFLQSPFFIYRAELTDEPLQGKLVPLGDWELASLLSYAVWNSMPDDELFRAAEAGELSNAAGLDAQVKRMLGDPRARAVVNSFFDQLYDGDQYTHLSKSEDLYPDFTPEVGVEMRTELGKFTEDVYERGGGVRELLTSTTTFVTPRIAAIYGLSADTLPVPDADGFSRVDLDPAQRSGLLTRSGFLAWKGTETQPNTILRGVFITRKIICQPLGDPPAAAQGATVGGQPTNRERIEALTGPGTCGAGCHGTYINNAGFALEHFGAIGEYRTDDNQRPINSAATFPFQEGPVAYADAVEFSHALAESPQVHACFAGYLLEYLVGRERVAADDLLAAQLTQRSISGASARDLLIAVLESDALRYPLATLEMP